MKWIRLFFILGMFFPALSLAQKASIQFVENKGQFPDKVKYFADIPGGRVFFQEDRVTYSFYDARELSHQHKAGHVRFAGKVSGHGIKAISMHSINVKFGEKHQESKIRGNGVMVQKRNYFIGNDPKQWASDCQVFESITYSEIFPDIDLTFYSSGGMMKYDILLKKGADYKDISMIYEGQERISLENGNVYIRTSLNEITENKPYAFSRAKNGRKSPIDCQYVLEKNRLSFKLNRNPQPGEVLVIDPLLIFSTYSGSFVDNWGFTAAFDQEGNLYSGGIAFGVGFPTTSGSFNGGQMDIGILKYDSTGSNLVYATYLGGDNVECPHSLIVNENNELIILGTTSSENFPVSNDALQSAFGGGRSFTENSLNYDNGSDIFVTKLSASGDEVLASTYMGGSGNDGVSRIINPLVKNYGDQYRGDVNVDKEGFIYVSSNTSSSDFPVSGGFQNTYGGGINDGVVFKLSGDLKSIAWSSYIGGNSEDAAYSVKFDSTGTVFIAGGTSSTDFPTTAGSIEETHLGDIDGFISKISNTGETLIASTYIGTSNYNQTYFLDLDTGNNVYVLGQTSGAYPFSPDVYRVPNSGQFIHKISNELDSILLTTVWGTGSLQPDISPTAFLVNECGNIYVSGWGSPQNNFSPPTGGTAGLPVTEDAFQSTTDGSDFYLMVMERDFKSLLSATFFGGGGPVSEHVDGGTSRFDKRGIVYHAVCADCGNGGGSAFPTTEGAYSERNNATNCNNAAFKFDLSSLLARLETNTPNFDRPGITVGCKPFEVAFINRTIGGVEYFWEFGNGESSRNTVLDTVIVTYPDVGSYPVTLTAVDRNTCKAIDRATTTIRVFEGNFDLSEDVTICEGETTRLFASGGNQYTWFANEEVVGNGPTIQVSPVETTEYILNSFDNSGCEYIDTVMVNVIPTVILDFEAIPIPDCSPQTRVRLINKSTGTDEFVWDLGGGNISEEFEPELVYPDTGTYTIQLRALGDNNGCTQPVSKTLTLTDFFVPNVFTPNEDNVNETFEIRSNYAIDLDILNRWGRPVFSEKDYQNTWTAKDVSPGVYFYEIRFRDSNETCNGWIQVLK